MGEKKYKKQKKQKKKSLIGRFFKVLFTVLILYFIGLLIFLYYYSKDKEIPIVDSIISTITPSVPEVTNALIVGVDGDETRTDTIMIVSYNSTYNSVTLISIPRDTLVKIPQSRWSIMVENYPALSSNISREIKINAIHSYGKEEGVEFLRLQLEEMLGINIDYYAKVNLEGFKYIVDSIGGIEFDVPQRMYYIDPTQDLYIDLQPGLQILDGDKAEQLIRFRSYSEADLQRVKVQQDFIKEFLKTVLSTKSVISNATDYIKTIINYVDTDFNISDALKYISVLADFNISNFESYTLPGTPEYINGASYYVTNENELEDFIYDIFVNKFISEEDLTIEDSFNKSIQVLNGSYTSGVASKTKKILTEAGYTVLDIGDSPYEKSEYTKIYVSKEGEGLDLKEYFSNAIVVAKPSLLEEHNYDIVIIIGTEEEFKENIS